MLSQKLPLCQTMLAANVFALELWQLDHISPPFARELSSPRGYDLIRKRCHSNTRTCELKTIWGRKAFQKRLAPFGILWWGLLWAFELRSISAKGRIDTVTQSGRFLQENQKINQLPNVVLQNSCLASSRDAQGSRRACC